jgi:hypothetical protein
MRTGDAVAQGRYGVDQHDGYDMQLVGRASAGCLVGKSVEAHQQFIVPRGMRKTQRL